MKGISSTPVIAVIIAASVIAGTIYFLPRQTQVTVITTTTTVTVTTVRIPSSGILGETTTVTQPTGTHEPTGGQETTDVSETTTLVTSTITTTTTPTPTVSGVENCCNQFDDDGDGLEDGADPECTEDHELNPGYNSDVCWATESMNYSNNMDYYSGRFKCPDGYLLEYITIKSFCEEEDEDCIPLERSDCIFSYNKDNQLRAKICSLENFDSSAIDCTEISSDFYYCTFIYDNPKTEWVKLRFKTDSSKTAAGYLVEGVNCTEAPVIDNDGDGYTSDDCDDTDANVNPGATEICDDNKDNDCDESIDEGCGCTEEETMQCGTTDVGECEYGTQTCVESEWGSCVGSVNPTDEVCDGKDNDCDGLTDEGVNSTFYEDNDEDGYGNLDVAVEACVAPTGYVDNNADCNDNDLNINPGADEICDDSIDNDCDDFIDEDCTGPPEPEPTDSDGDGYSSDVDCDDTDASINPSATEICDDNKDNDCDGFTNEDCPIPPESTDSDGDGVIDEEDVCPDNPGIGPSGNGCNGCPDPCQDCEIMNCPTDGTPTCELDPSCDACPNNQFYKCECMCHTETSDIGATYSSCDYLDDIPHPLWELDLSYSCSEFGTYSCVNIHERCFKYRLPIITFEFPEGKKYEGDILDATVTGEHPDGISHVWINYNKPIGPAEYENHVEYHYCGGITKCSHTFSINLDRADETWPWQVDAYTNNTKGHTVHSQTETFIVHTGESECTSGDCCDPSTRTFRPSTYVCDEPNEVEYGCPLGTGCGSDVYKKTLEKIYCPGDASTCTGDESWSGWSKTLDCDSTQRCNPVDFTCKSDSYCEDGDNGGGSGGAKRLSLFDRLIEIISGLLGIRR